MAEASINCHSGASGSLTVLLSGDWLLGQNLPGPDPILDRLRQKPKPANIAFESVALGEWDIGLITMLIAIHKSAVTQGVSVDESGLPEGARKLISLSLMVKEREGARL